MSFIKISLIWLSSTLLSFGNTLDVFGQPIIDLTKEKYDNEIKQINYRSREINDGNLLIYYPEREVIIYTGGKRDTEIPFTDVANFNNGTFFTNIFAFKMSPKLNLHEGLLFCGNAVENLAVNEYDTNRETHLIMAQNCVFVHVTGEALKNGKLYLRLEDFSMMANAWDEFKFYKIEFEAKDKFFCHNIQNLWHVLTFLYPHFRNKYALTDLFNEIENTRIIHGTLNKINCISTAQYIRMYCGLSYQTSGVAKMKLKHGKSLTKSEEFQNTDDNAVWTCVQYIFAVHKQVCHNISNDCMTTVPFEVTDHEIMGFCTPCLEACTKSHVDESNLL